MAGLLDVYNMVTGNTPDNRRNAFIDKELPVIATQIRDATTEQEISAGAAGLIGAAQKAGYGPKNVELLLDKLVQPALANLGAGELQKIGARFKPRDTYIDEKRPDFQVVEPGEGQGLAGMMPAKLQTVPGKQFDQGDAMDIAGVTSRFGMKTPQGMAGMLQAPSVVDENMAQAGAANALAAQRQREEQLRKSQQETLDNLPDERDATTGLSARDVGMGSRGTGLAGIYSTQQNNAAQAPVRQSTVNLNKARVGTEGARQGELGTRSTANVALAERRRRPPGGTDADGNPIETVVETERFVNSGEQVIAERAIARKAVDRGATTPEEIAQIADDLGYELQGDVTLEGAEGYFGTSLGAGTPALKGNFSLRPRQGKRTTTKGKIPPGGKPTAASPMARAQPKPAGKRPSLDEIWGTKVK